jgi:hypothetical protein
MLVNTWRDGWMNEEDEEIFEMRNIYRSLLDDAFEIAGDLRDTARWFMGFYRVMLILCIGFAGIGFCLALMGSVVAAILPWIASIGVAGYILAFRPFYFEMKERFARLLEVQENIDGLRKRLSE